MPSPYETPSTADQIKSAERDLENALADPRKASRIDVYEERIQKLKRQLKKEKDEIKPHPAWVGLSSR